MARHRHAAIRPVLYFLFAIFCLIAAPLQAQEPAALLQQHAAEILASVQQERPTDAIPAATALIQLLDANPGLATVEHAVSLNALALAFHNTQKYDAATPFYRKALDLLRRSQDPAAAANLIVVLENYALLLLAEPDFTTAGQCFAEALNLRNELYGGEHPDFLQHLTGLNSLALHLQEHGDYATAESLLRAILEAKRQVLGTAHPEYGVALNNLARLLYVKAEYAAAEPLYRESLAIIRASRGTEHVDYISALGNLALLLQVTGDLAAAEPLLRESLELRRRVQGAEHPDYALALNNLAQLLYSKANYADAEHLYREALRIFAATVGTDDPDYAITLGNLALLLQANANLAGAETLLRETSEIYRRLYGPTHPDYAASLANLARLLHRKGDHTAAEADYQAALEIWRGNQMTEHPNFVETLSSLGRLRMFQGALEEADSLFSEALELRRRIQGPSHPGYARELKNLAELRATTAAFTEAESLYHEALEIWRQALGTDHPEYIEGLAGLAIMLQEKGDYDAAEPLLREAIETRRRTLGTEHPDYAAALNNLALLLHLKANYAGAEPLYREALEIWRLTPGTDQQNYASALGNLAQLLMAIGNLAAAEPLLHESIEVRRRVQGTEHTDYALALNNLARFYVSRGEYDAAEPLYREAARIFATTLGTGHPSHATVIGNLASVLRHQGKYDDAITILREALDVARRTLGTEHPAYSRALNNLAVLLADGGDLNAAEPLYLEALRIGLRRLGSRHPESTNLLVNLATLNQSLGRPDSALASMERALVAEQELLEQVFGFTSEHGMLAYANSVRTSLSILLSMVELRPDNVAASTALRWVLLRKGAVLSALSTYRQVERIAATDPDVATTLSRLHDTRRQLTSMALNPPAGVAPDSLNHIMGALNRRREALEVGLSRSLSAHLKGDILGAPGESADSTTDLTELRRALPRTGALIEFIRYLKIDFRNFGADQRPATPHYAALILRPTGPVRWVALGEADEIENAIRDLRTAHMGCEGGEKSQFCSESNYRAAAEEAYLRIFDPLEPHLEGIEHLIASLDGELNQVPFGALVDLGGQYLIERFHIAYVSSGRDLLRPQGSTGGSGTTVFAGPTFDLLPTAQAGGAKSGARSSDAAVGDVAASTPRTPAAPEALRGLKWDELPGALAEAGDVKAALHGTPRGPITVRTAAEATEDALKATRAPRILHLATHGFFIPERDLTPEERAACLAAGSGPEQQLDLETGMGRGIERLRCAENPLLRSGIVLAGANAVGATGSNASPEDGWVLAEEIATLDLAGTELVVLSACETGLGDVKTGEGVYGLRRAFELAGAERILMSLFKVPDSATRELLSGFYRRLAAGKGAEEALRESQLELRTKHPHPFYWASFVLVGGGK